jgi:hypothetical protein
MLPLTPMCRHVRPPWQHATAPEPAALRLLPIWHLVKAAPTFVCNLQSSLGNEVQKDAFTNQIVIAEYSDTGV